VYPHAEPCLTGNPSALRKFAQRWGQAGKGLGFAKEEGVSWGWSASPQ